MCRHCECHGGRGYEGHGHHHHGGHEHCGYDHERWGDGCCCGGHGEGGSRHSGRCGCGASHPWGFYRRFVSRAERIAELEAYLAELRAEITAVEEHLAELKKTT